MIIWGFRWRNSAARKAGKAVACFVGGELVYYAIIKQQRWFTFFFIPLFPTATRYYITCPEHGGSKRITREAALELLGNTATVNSGPVSTAERADNPKEMPVSIEKSASTKEKMPVGRLLALLALILKSLYVAILYGGMGIALGSNSTLFADSSAGPLLAVFAILALPSLAMVVFGWLAFAKYKKSGWRLYLLVYGILSCVQLFGVFRFPVLLVNIATGVLLILSFALGRKIAQQEI